MDSSLVMDVGLHDGRDAAYYLTQGYRVVGVEANPVLVEQVSRRFRAEIDSRRLTVLNVGIAEANSVATFWVNDRDSEHSSFVKSVGCRNGSPCHPIEVTTSRLKPILEKYGVPYYLKIDIERNDGLCLEDLDARDLPKYVSIEAHVLAYLSRLQDLGYTRFKIVDQMSHGMPLRPGTNETLLGRARGFAWHHANRIRRSLRATPYGPSGPIGEDTSGPWRSFDEVAADWLHHDRRETHAGALNVRSWYDFHASRG